MGADLPPELTDDSPAGSHHTVPAWPGQSRALDGSTEHDRQGAVLGAGLRCSVPKVSDLGILWEQTEQMLKIPTQTRSSAALLDLVCFVIIRNNTY